MILECSASFFRKQDYWSFFYCLHIFLQFYHISPFKFQFSKTCYDRRYGRIKSGIQIYFSIVIHKYPRIKWKCILFFSPPYLSFRITYMSIKLKRSTWTITHCHPHHSHKIKSIIKIVSSIFSSCNIRCKEQPKSQSVFRILSFTINNTLKTPTFQVVHRC